MTLLPPVLRRMYGLLSDGRPHTPQELHACLHDDLGALSNIKQHLYTLRQRIRPFGQDVAFERVNGSRHYRLVRLVASPYRD